MTLHDLIVLKYAELPRLVRKPLWRFWHNLILGRDRDHTDVRVTFLNYGFAPLSGNPNTITLEPRDEPERFPAQLYHRALRSHDVNGDTVLEVGSGRGGGASYITRYFRPKRYVGLDLAPKNIRFCNEYHGSDRLSFVQGDAERLPFADGSFDTVLNVESSRCYGNISRFFAEVRRVLRKHGVFLLTDMRWKDDLPQLRSRITAAGFTIAEEENVTPNVARALDLDDRRRRGMIEQKIPKFLARAFGEFAGVKGSRRYSEFVSGRMQYVSMLLRAAV